MIRSPALVLALLLTSLGCRATHEDPPHASAPVSGVAIAPAGTGAGIADAAETPPAAPPASAPTILMADADVGPLIERLSEKPGNFPSENYVTNEASLLHVAPALRSAKLKGRAYVGVGPEQNYAYLALLEPRVAYVVDIRRGNLLEHLMFRGCFEAGKTRAEFLTALLARREPHMPRPTPCSAPRASRVRRRSSSASPSCARRATTRRSRRSTRHSRSMAWPSRTRC